MQYLYIYKIKNIDLWKQWIAQLNSQKEEIRITLEREKILQEGIFVDEVWKFVYYLIESEDLSESIKIFNESILPIDVEHKKIVWECLEFIDCIMACFFQKIEK